MLIRRKKWGEEEDKVLRRCYPIMTAREIGEKLKRSRVSVKSRCLKLGLKKGYIFRWTNKEIILTFRNLTKKLGKTPTYDDCRTAYPGMTDAICRVWGRYNSLLKYLGLKTNIKEWTKNICINEFNKLRRKIKKEVPTQKDLNHCPGLWKAILRRWKTYNKFLKELNLKPNFEIKWNMQTCENEFFKIVKKFKRIPTSEELKKINHGLLGGILKNFKTYNNFLHYMSFPPHQKDWSKEKCTNEFKILMKNRKVPPTIEELYQINSKLTGAILRRFKYNNFLKMLSYEPHYGFNDDRWELWEKFVIKSCKSMYKNVLIKPTLKNRGVPDVVIGDDTFQSYKIIDAKLNVFCKSIKKDIKNYKKYCNKLEFWCMFGEKDIKIQNVNILNRHQIRNLLRKFNKLDLVNELEVLESKCYPKS